MRRRQRRRLINRGDQRFAFVFGGMEGEHFDNENIFPPLPLPPQQF